MMKNFMNLLSSLATKIRYARFYRCFERQKDDSEIDDIYHRYEDLLCFYVYLKGHDIRL